MKSFSTKVFGIAGAAMMFSSMAFAQATCGTLTPSGGFVRAEGQNEIVPSFQFACTTTGAAATATVQLFLSPTVVITSAVTASSTNTTEIAATNAVGPVTVNGTVPTGSSTVTFSGLAIPAAGSATFTVSGIRINATGIPTAVGATPSSLSVTAFYSGINVTPGSIASGIVAYVLNGLGSTTISADPNGTLTNRINSTTAPTFTAASSVFTTTTAFGVCNSYNNSTSTAAYPAFYVKVNEGFANSFKTVLGETTSTTANSATRIKVTLTNVPSGLNLYAPVQVYQGTGAFGTATAIGTAQISETAPTNGTANNQTAVSTPAQVSSLLATGQIVQNNTATGYGINGGVYLVPVSNNTATIVYEIGTSNPGAIDSLLIPVYFQSGSAAIASQSASLSAAVSFAPITSATTYPSFAVGTSTSTTGITTFTQCTTTLLFPFVSNASGFETGIAISNTSIKTNVTGFASSVANTAQSGTCNLAFFGTGGTNPSTVQAPNPNEGGTAPYNTQESYAFTLSQALAVNSANPATFTGFILAQCNFQYAHGFAYITYGGLGTPNAVAMGYLAEVLTSRGSTSTEGVTF